MYGHAPPLAAEIDNRGHPALLPEEPNAYKSPAPAVGIAVWVDMVATMDREHLDRFTRSTRRRFDETDLEPLKWAVIRRRRVVARQAWP